MVVPQEAFLVYRSLHAKHEDKASKYLTFISIIIAAISIFSKQYLFDNPDKGIFITLFFV